MSSHSSSGALPAGLDTEQLRAAVRAVLRDVLPAELVQVATAAATPTEPVSVRDDGELDTLVRRVAALCEDPARRAALRDGRHGFRLARDGAGATAGRAARGPSSAAGIVRVDRGAVTERAVAQAAADGARLVLGPKAVLTPLARDKARVLGVEIEKER